MWGRIGFKINIEKRVGITTDGMIGSTREWMHWHDEVQTMKESKSEKKEWDLEEWDLGRSVWSIMKRRLGRVRDG
jgi:hypothetical protein